MDAPAPRRPTRRRALRAGVVGLGGLTIIGGGVVGAIAALTPGEPERLTVERPPFVDDAPVPHDDNPGQRFFLVKFPVDARGAAESLYPLRLLPAIRSGVLALRRLCPNGDVMLPYCASSRMFECPGCGSRFNRVGEYVEGPAPTGMTLVLLRPRSDGTIEITFDRTSPGLARGRHAVSIDAAGPHCVASE